MPTFRPEISAIPPYVPGRPIEEVAREFGFDPAEIVKLASNESPLPPFPEAEVAMRTHVGVVHRYPDNDCHDLRHALAEHLGVPAGAVWPGAGSSELLRASALACGGAGTSAVYAWPSFVVYRIGSTLAGSAHVEVPLAPGFVHDLDAMAAAVRDDTTVVYLCNPNNPTGTLLAPEAIERFVDGIPENVLVVVDEAYHEFVTAPGHRSAVPLALERSNVVVTRTFSKIYGLASLRVGYAIGRPDIIAELRKAQAPFSVTGIGQVAAVESLRHPDETERRRRENAVGRAHLEARFALLDLEYVPSQANFVYLHLPGTDPAGAFLRRAVIIRPFRDGWVRVTVGTGEENERFLDVLEEVLAEGGLPPAPAPGVLQPDG